MALTHWLLGEWRAIRCALCARTSQRMRRWDLMAESFCGAHKRGRVLYKRPGDGR